MNVHVREERSLDELFAELSREMSTLVRQEMALAKAEMSQAASRLGMGAAMIAAGGAVAYAGFLAVTAAVIVILAALIPWWLSALAVGLVWAGAGYLLIQRGRGMLNQIDPVPHRTLATLERLTNGTTKRRDTA